MRNATQTRARNKSSRRLVVRSELSADCSRSTNIPIIGSRPITYVWRDIGSISCIRKGRCRPPHYRATASDTRPSFLPAFHPPFFRRRFVSYPLSRPPRLDTLFALASLEGGNAHRYVDYDGREKTKKNWRGFQGWIYLWKISQLSGLIDTLLVQLLLEYENLKYRWWLILKYFLYFVSQYITLSAFETAAASISCNCAINRCLIERRAEPDLHRAFINKKLLRSWKAIGDVLASPSLFRKL